MTSKNDNKKISENTESACFIWENHDPEIEKKWTEESEARYEAYNRGETATTNWDEIKKRYLNITDTEYNSRKSFL